MVSPVEAPDDPQRFSKKMAAGPAGALRGTITTIFVSVQGPDLGESSPIRTRPFFEPKNSPLIVSSSRGWTTSGDDRGSTLFQRPVGQRERIFVPSCAPAPWPVRRSAWLPPGSDLS